MFGKKKAAVTVTPSDAQVVDLAAHYHMDYRTGAARVRLGIDGGYFTKEQAIEGMRMVSATLGALESERLWKLIEYLPSEEDGAQRITGTFDNFNYFKYRKQLIKEGKLADPKAVAKEQKQKAKAEKKLAKELKKLKKRGKENG